MRVTNKKPIICIALAILAIIVLIVFWPKPEDADLSDTVYENEKTVAALQVYLFDDMALEYSQSEIEGRILCSYVSKTGIMYCLMQLSYISEEGRLSPDIDVAKVLFVKHSTAGDYIAGAYTPGYVLGPTENFDVAELPYEELVLPEVEKNIYFIATKIFDDRYKAYYNGNELTPNKSGIVAIVIESDNPPTPEQKPYITLE